jgi:glyoxylase-like metal-dependent hydrolase (beta-lactamase superfamily II)
VIFSGPPGGGDRSWVLIDTGLFFSARRIVRGAARRFGPGARPAAIVLTHGHFDHAGAVRRLAERWDAPVYAHQLELPHITGAARYLPPNPRAGGGLMALLSPFYPRGPVDVGHRARVLPADGSIPGMPGWRWVHTPGHTAGHVALFREADRVLVAGDAFVTTKQESLLAVMTQRRELHGPPAYFTPDWRSARQSVETLAELEPARVISGHGRALYGAGMREELHRLARDFGRRGVPRHGRYAPAQALRTA